jgi:hypothetical protein
LCYAKEFLVTKPELHGSLLAVVINAQEAQRQTPHIPTPDLLRREFILEGWQQKFRLEQGKQHTQYFDFFKSRVAIEIEFSRYEFIYRDFIRFLAAYNANKIDLGDIITNTKAGMQRIKHKSSGPSFERVCEELDWLRPTLTVPLWVIGLK